MTIWQKIRLDLPCCPLDLVCNRSQEVSNFSCACQGGDLRQSISLLNPSSLLLLSVSFILIVNSLVKRCCIFISELHMHSEAKFALYRR